MNKLGFRARYAPSPTGYLHIGNARTALFNYLLAKHYNGVFIIRIEDTDIKRNVDDAIQTQFDELKWLGILADESILKPGRYGPYRQLKRLPIYKEHIETLLEKGLAYHCFCSEAELEASRLEQKSDNIKAPKYNKKCRNLTKAEVAVLKNKSSYTIRFKVDSTKTYSYNDEVRGLITFSGSDIGDFVILKSNGIPTYNFCAVVDDGMMNITHVIRGEEHISNTPKQLMIYEAYKWKPPIFLHLTLITNDKHQKLSKRDNNIMQYISQYHSKGYLPAAMINYLAFLGWSPETTNEFFSKEELIKIFSITRLSKSPGMFDIKKLNWINANYIKKLSDEDFYNLCYPFLEAKYKVQKISKEWIMILINAYKTEIQFGAEIIDYTEQFFIKKEVFHYKYKQLFFDNNYSIALVNDFCNKLNEMVIWKPDSIASLIKELSKKYKIRGKQLYMALRLALTNSDHGPDLDKVIYLLGKENVIANVKYIND